jgi:outer membrane lipoprotein SlyB
MKNIKTAWVVPVVFAVGLVGCETPGGGSYGSTGSGGYSSQTQSAEGYVERIEVVNRSTGSGSNIAGTVIGGVVGGLIGSQIGSGSGQTVATIAGAAGGAIAGNKIEGRRRADNETFRVTVRLDNGTNQTVTQDNIDDLRTGDRVRIEGNQVRRI